MAGKNDKKVILILEFDDFHDVRCTDTYRCADTKPNRLIIENNLTKTYMYIEINEMSEQK